MNYDKFGDSDSRVGGVPFQPRLNKKRLEARISVGYGIFNSSFRNWKDFPKDDCLMHGTEISQKGSPLVSPIF